MVHKKFKGLIDSKINWIGGIPKHWRISKFKHEFVFSKSTNTSKNPTILSLTLQGIKIRDISTNEGQIASSYDNYTKVYKGDIVLNPMDLISGFVDSSPVEGVISPAYYTLKPNNDINPEYYKYYLQKHYYEKIFFPFAEGVSVDHRWTLKKEDFLNFSLIKPPIEEQKQISNYLNEKTNEIDEAINKNKQLIELLEEKKCALINRTVTKGLNSDSLLKDSGIEWIGEINNEFKLTRLKFHCEIYGRIGFRGYTTSDIVDEGEGAITLSPSNINNQKFDLTTKKYLSWMKYEESPEIKIFNNDVLFVKTGSSVGKTCIIKNLSEKATINPQLVVFKNIKINNEYLYYVLSSNIVQYQVLLNLKGGTIPTLTQDDIQNYIIPLPNLETQKLIVSYLNDETSKIDRIILKINKNIQLFEEYKISLIHHVVTGKIDIGSGEI